MGYKVLLVDADPQGDLSSYLGYEGTENGATISDLMESVIKDEKPPEVVIHNEEKVDFIPSDIGLSDMEVSLVNVMAHEKIMEQALEPFKDKYDYCLIDCMPSLGILTVASLVAADRVLIPVQAQHFALEGVVSLIKSINQITRRIKPELEIDGIVLTMVDRRTNLSKDVCAALRSSYGHALKIYRTEIPVSTRTAESASSAHSVLRYDASGPASIAYKTLAKEVVENERVWGVMQSLHNAMIGIGYALIVLFFAISLFKNTANFHELKRPEAAVHYLIRFVAAKTLVGYGMDIMLNIFSICNGIVSDMAAGMGGISQAMVTLPGEVQAAIENVGFLASIPLWLVTILGSLFITVLSFVMILTVYGRFFRLYMYTALAPLPLASFAGESTQSVGISFIKSYVGVCLEGAVIVLACVIYAAFVSTPTVSGGEATTMVWSYLTEIIFNMLVLVGLIKGSDRIIHEMMGL